MLEKYKIPYDELHFGKPVADFYVDDKGYKLEDWDNLKIRFIIYYERFFDTANLEFIKETSKTEGKTPNHRGGTTNPNAFNKIEEPSLFKWVEIAEEIGNFANDLRQDNKGVIHIQLPLNLNIDKAIKFANYISELPKDKMTIGMKIHVQIFENVDELNDIVLTNALVFQIMQQQQSA